MRYGDVHGQPPGQYANPPSSHWYFSRLFSVSCTAGRILAVSMPGSENASPRSAASSNASAREPRCSAQPYGYSTRYRAPSARPTIAVDEMSTRRPPTPGTTLAGIVSVSVAVGLASVASPYAATVSGRHEHFDRDDVFERVGLVANLRRHLDPRASNLLRRWRRTALHSIRRRPSGSVSSAPVVNSRTSGSRLLIVTVAAPASFN